MLRSVNSIVETRRNIHCRSIQSEIDCIGKECTSRKHVDCSSHRDSTSFIGDFWFRMFLFIVDLPDLQSLVMKGQNFQYFTKIVIRSMDSCLLCSVDVKQLKKIHANGSGYFSNVVNYVIEGLNE